ARGGEARAIAGDAGPEAFGRGEAAPATRLQGRDGVEFICVAVAGCVAGGPALGGDDRPPGSARRGQVGGPADGVPVHEGVPDVGARFDDTDTVAAPDDGGTEVVEAARLAV